MNVIVRLEFEYDKFCFQNCFFNVSLGVTKQMISIGNIISLNIRGNWACSWSNLLEGVRYIICPLVSSHGNTVHDSKIKWIVNEKNEMPTWHKPPFFFKIILWVTLEYFVLWTSGSSQVGSVRFPCVLLRLRLCIKTSPCVLHVSKGLWYVNVFNWIE